MRKKFEDTLDISKMKANSGDVQTAFKRTLDSQKNQISFISPSNDDDPKRRSPIILQVAIENEVTAIT